MVRWSAKFVFNAELSHSPPLIQSIPNFLKMTVPEQENAKAANEPLLVEEALLKISNAKEHDDISSGLSIISEVLLRYNLQTTVFDLKWKSSFDRYFSDLVSIFCENKIEKTSKFQ